MQKALWSKSKEFKVNSIRFLVVTVLSAVFIGIIGNVVKGWWIGIFYVLMWSNVPIAIIVPIALTVYEMFDWMPSKMRDVIDNYPKIMNSIFFFVFLSLTYVMGYTLFINLDNLVLKMNTSKELTIVFGTLVYGAFISFNLIMLSRIIFHKKKSHEICIDSEVYDIVNVVSDDLFQLKAQDGSGYRFVDITTLSSGKINEK